MTPAEYLNNVVLPTVIEFRDDPRDQRRAYLACLVTAHLADYIAAQDSNSPRNASLGKVRKAVRLRVADHFDLVVSICNAAKHSGPGRDPAFPFKPGDDVERRPLKWGEFEWGMPIYAAGFGGRDVEVDGKKYDIYVCVAISLMAFAEEFPQHIASADLSEVYSKPNIPLPQADSAEAG